MDTLGTTNPYFQIHVTKEQTEYADRIVRHSIDHHPVTDIFAHDPEGKKRQYEFRFTGSLGEIVFADAYCLPRPTRSFGAIDGQDYGQDFRFPYHGKEVAVDVKSMHRRSDPFRENYVLNLPRYQLEKRQSVTDYYFCINFHEREGTVIASFLGLVDKKTVLGGQIGDLFLKDTERIRQDGTSFIFMRDTYEVMFRHLLPPPLTPYIESLAGFRKKYLKEGRDNNLY